MQDLPDRPFLSSAFESLERKIKQGKAVRVPVEINYKGTKRTGFGIEYTNMFIIVSKIEVKDILKKVAHLCLGRQYLNSAKAIRRAKFELCKTFNTKHKTNFYPAKIVVGELEELPERADFYVKLISENLRSQGKALLCYDSEEIENALENVNKLVNTGHLLSSFRLDRTAFDMIRDGSYGQAEAISDWARRKLAFSSDIRQRAEPIEGERPGQRNALYQRVYDNLLYVLNERLRNDLNYYRHSEIPASVLRSMQVTIATMMSCRLPFSFRPEDFILDKLPYGCPIFTVARACIDRLIREENRRWSPHEAPKPNGIGDTTCVNNARSKYLKCAVNPMGDCEVCEHYESDRPVKETIEARFKSQPPISVNFVPTETTAPHVERVSNWEPAETFLSKTFRDKSVLQIHLTNQQRRDLTAMLLNEQGGCTILIDDSEMRVNS